jgi:thioester reductase-like protein
VHNAEISDLTYRYQQLKNENINSTYELIKMAKQVKKKQFIFLSTTGLGSGNSESKESIDRNLSFRESQGYLASKWVAEAMIKNADIDYQIYRLPRASDNVPCEKGLLHELMNQLTDFAKMGETV